MEQRRAGGGFLRAFLVSVLGTGMSRVLGAVRDIVIAGFLGAGASSDAFWIAFTIPNIFRRFVADEGLTGALIPEVGRAERDEGEAAARSLANAVLGALLVANLLLCVVGFVFAEPLVYAFAASFADDPEKFALTAQMTRWLMPFVAMVSVVSLMEGLLNYRDHFFVPKIAPGFVSLGIAVAVLGFGTRFQEPAWALVVGVLVGGVVHVAVNVPVLWRRWGALYPALDLGNPRVRSIAWELSKVVAIGVFAQVNIIALRQLAAYAGDGAVTRYWYANRLVDLAQGMIAVAIGSALLPGITRAAVARDWTGFREELVRALRLAAFLLIPVCAVLVSFAEPITAILFRRGDYSYADVQWTAWTLMALAPFMLAVAGINIVKKAFFAIDDRNTLLAVGAVGVGVTVAAGMLLIDAWNIVGLGLALSLSATLQLAAYFVLLRRRVGVSVGLGELADPVGRMIAASLPMGAVLWGATTLGDWSLGPSDSWNLAVLCGGLGVAWGVYGVLAWVLGVEELRKVLDRVYARVRPR